MRDSRSGFTLLEILLASVLAAALLLTLWSLIGTYTSLFSTGDAKTEQSQIARSLLQQMTDDLSSAIQDTAVRARLQTKETATARDEVNDNTQENTVRRFGLYGTRDELRIDVLQIVPLEVSLAAYRADEENGPETLAADEPRRRAPELRTVRYKFNKRRELGELESLDEMSFRDETSVEMEETLLGLVREEMDFETRSSPATMNRLVGWLSERSTGITKSEQDTFKQFDEVGGEETESDIDARIDSGAVLWVPEVVGLEFRYFDGSGWTSQWDSIKRKSLPVAVEIRLEIESLDPRAVRRRAAAKAAGETLEEGMEFVGAAGDAGDEERISTEEIRLENEQEANLEV
ncbi:MAG: hypothetical protein JXM70_10730, partial [Pirellulales bacterium]|nr:hypothetical protein [Pirellulales bacterium]